MPQDFLDAAILNEDLQFENGFQIQMLIDHDNPKSEQRTLQKKFLQNSGMPLNMPQNFRCRWN